jgi:8-oxo-dGTP diphosphatase
MVCQWKPDVLPLCRGILIRIRRKGHAGRRAAAQTGLGSASAFDGLISRFHSEYAARVQPVLIMIIREYPQNPVVAVGAVVVHDGKVLLIRRGKEPSMGQWSIPGGAVEVGEMLREALRREVSEETGMVVRVGEVIEVLDRILPDPAGQVQFHYVLIDFACSVESGTLQAASDVSDACWASPEDFARFELRPDTLRVILKGMSESTR